MQSMVIAIDRNDQNVRELKMHAHCACHCCVVGEKIWVPNSPESSFQDGCIYFQDKDIETKECI